MESRAMVAAYDEEKRENSEIPKKGDEKDANQY
jgi:hypothetical protein